MSNTAEAIKWHPIFQVEKYHKNSMDALRRDLGHEPTFEEMRELERIGAIEPDDVVYAEGNALTTTGIQRLWACASGLSSAIQMTAAGTFMGVGSSSTAWATGQTDLQGTKAFRQVNSGPTAATSATANDAVQYSVQFGSGAAEHAWNEWCIGTVLSGSASSTVQTSLASVGTTPVIINRAVSSLGTKGAGSTWTLTAKITLI